MSNDAWALFARTLTQEMAKSGTSTRDLYKRLSGKIPKITEETVANWRRGRSRPSLESLGAIVDAVNFERRTPADEEPFSLLVLLQKMNVVPADAADEAEVFDQAYRLLKLQLKRQDAEDALADLGRKGSSARIVQAAVASGEWAVAVWPVYEGPGPAHRLHIADRIDIQRTGAKDTENVDDQVWSDPALKAALRATNAMPSIQSPRWSKVRRRSDDSPEPDGVSRWAISHVTTPREPIVSSHWRSIRGVALVATTRRSLVNEVASLVAVGLGYGIISTPQLAMTAIGRRPTKTRVGDQYRIHQHLLANPPHRRVWSHWGMPPGLGDLPFGTYSSVEGSTPRFIFLDESDAMLRETVDDRLTFDELGLARGRLRTAARAFPPDHLLQLPAEHSGQHERWVQVFRHAARILEWLSSPSVGALSARSLREAHSYAALRDPDVAAPFLEWLRTEANWPRDESDDRAAST